MSVTLSPLRISRNNFKAYRYVIALALMLWCAGTGCVLVSYAHASMNHGGAATADSPTNSLSGIEAGAGSHGSCHAAHAHSKARVSNSKSAGAAGEQVTLPTTPVSPGAMSCCPLASGSIVATSRLRTNDEQAIALVDNASTYFAFANSRLSPLAFPPRLPNQNQIYLRGCVFLI